MLKQAKASFWTTAFHPFYPERKIYVYLEVTGPFITLQPLAMQTVSMKSNTEQKVPHERKG